MGNFEDFTNALTNWSFGIIILIGLVSSDFLGSEVLISILLSAFTTTLSALSGSACFQQEEQFSRRKTSNLLYFLIIWLDVLTNLVAAATCARFASATVDYISYGHFREFLFGIESHSLGEPWPDVLGVTIVIVVIILFMLGLEKSSIISWLLFAILLCSFVFFTFLGSFHTVIPFWKWCESFKIHTWKSISRAAAICSYAFVKQIPRTHRNNGLKMCTMIFGPLLFYVILTVIFSLMTHRRELARTALPLIQIYEHRDVDWARPVMAVFTICIVCLVLTEILPNVYATFVKLASKEWQIFVSSMQYQSSLTGAPVLAIFAAGSLTAILAFACPLSHLIKLLNSTSILSSIINSIQLLYNRYKAEIYQNECLVYNTNVQYSKLNNTLTRNCHQDIGNKIKSIFGIKTNCMSRMNASKVKTQQKTDERECLLLDDYSNKSIRISEDSGSDNDEDELVRKSDDEDSGETTDIDLIVQEYKEGLQVTTVENFNKKRLSTRITFITSITCISIIIILSIFLSLYILKYIHIIWPAVVGLVILFIIIICMPQNSEDKEKVQLLPPLLYSSCLILSIILNIVLFSTIVNSIWQGIIFWISAGLFLFYRCDCCTCDGLFTIYKNNKRLNSSVNPDIIYEYKDENCADIIYITR